MPLVHIVWVMHVNRSYDHYYILHTSYPTCLSISGLIAFLAMCYVVTCSYFIYVLIGMLVHQSMQYNGLAQCDLCSVVHFVICLLVISTTCLSLCTHALCDHLVHLCIPYSSLAHTIPYNSYAHVHHVFL